MKKRILHKQLKALTAFTLAEVLIVLGIIGVVAEMTIPTLVQNTQKQVLRISFKKAYSTISEAVALTKLDLGVEDIHSYYTYYDGSSYTRASEFTDAFYKQLKTMGTKNYDTPPVNFNRTAGAYWSAIGWEAPNIVLPDGSTINCMINASQINISVDTNGPAKKPNRTGYDIFGFTVDGSDTVQPRNPSDWPAYYICSASSTATWNGLGCSYFAQIDKNPDDSTKGYWDSLK